jgi:hypothetical protein
MICRSVSLGFLLCLVNVTASIAETPRAELYTMGPGDELFNIFGHAALCVETEAWSPALCFNYGTADFSRPVGLTWDVLRGRAEFYVAVYRIDDMLMAYKSQDRTVYRQILPLSTEQVLKLAEKLDDDSQPDNRDYLYDHFFENCSTKPRDLIDSVTGGVLGEMRRAENPTYRELVDEGLGRSWLLMFLGDLFLGRRLERVATPYESMFLPRELREAVAEGLGSLPTIVYSREASVRPIRPEAARSYTWLLMVGFAGLTSIAIGRRKTLLFKVARVIVGWALGGLGVLLLFLAVASSAPEIRYNENLLVFLATDFLLVTSKRALIAWYAKLRVFELALVGLLAVAGVFVQPLWPFWLAAMVPLLALAVFLPTGK